MQLQVINIKQALDLEKGLELLNWNIMIISFENEFEKLPLICCIGSVI